MNENLIKLLNISCKTVEIHKLMVQQATNVNFDMRPTMHLLLSGKAGSFKSEMFNLIEKAYKSPTHPVELLTDVTAPGIAGTIECVDKHRIISFPTSFKAKGGTLFLDEMNLHPVKQSEVIRCLLTFLESEKTIRKMGISLGYDKIDNLNCYSSEMGWLKFWNLRCNTILVTMRDIRYVNSNKFYGALLTRCVPIVIDLQKEDLPKMFANRDLIFKKLNFETPEFVQIEQKDFEYLLNKVMVKETLSFIHTTRCLNNLLRCFAVLQRHDEELYKYVIDCHSLIPQPNITEEEKDELLF